MKTETRKEKKILVFPEVYSSGNMLFFGDCSCWRFSLPEAAPFPAERDSSLYVLAKLLGVVICHPFLSGCLGELDTPLQHSPLFGVLKTIAVPEIVGANSSSPGFGSPDSAESSWIICMGMERHKRLAEISETWRSRILWKALICVKLPGRASFSLVLTLSFRRIQSPTQGAEIVHD